LWNPSILGSSLLAWYNAKEAASFTESLGEVQQWRDLSGNGFHLDQGAQPSRPILNATALNGLPSVVFDGSNDCVRSDPATYPWPAPQAQPFAVYLVFKPPPFASFPTNSRRLWTGFNRNLGGSNLTYTFDYFAYAGGANPVAIIGGAGSSGGGTGTFGDDYRVYSTAGVPFQPDNVVVSGLVFDGAFGSLRRFYGQTVGQATGQILTGQLYGLCLAADGNGGTASLFSASSISEVIVVTGSNATTLATQQQIEGYLAWSWGVEDGLIAGHPYKNSPPTL
jgi:hypothetical protein